MFCQAKVHFPRPYNRSVRPMSGVLSSTYACVVLDRAAFDNLEQSYCLNEGTMFRLVIRYC